MRVAKYFFTIQVSRKITGHLYKDFEKNSQLVDTSGEYRAGSLTKL